MGTEKARKKAHPDPKISTVFLRWLLVIAACGFVLSILLTGVLRSVMARNVAYERIRANISDAGKDIQSAGSAAAVAQNRRVGGSGQIIITDENLKIISSRNGDAGKDISTAGIYVNTTELREETRLTADVYGVPSYVMCVRDGDYYIFGNMPKSETVFLRNATILLLILMETVVFGLLFGAVYRLIRRLIVDNIHKVNASLSDITDGKLDTVVDVRGNREFDALSDGINTTVQTLQHYIDAEKQRIGRELDFARAVQISALPSVFSPFPDHPEVDLYAGMRAAREVGGDFYDFFFVGNDRLVFLIADVSDKGIPAAMFMMTTKSILKSYAEAGMPVEEVLTAANAKLCENNETGMFVTVWMGMLDLKTGSLTFANAGHNPPVLFQDGQMSFLKTKPGFVLAGMEGMRYRTGQATLAAGDAVFLYTDGITEAADRGGNLYGEKRLLAVLRKQAWKSSEECCRAVRQDVSSFSEGAPQADDMTMLCLIYRGV